MFRGAAIRKVTIKVHEDRAVRMAAEFKYPDLFTNLALK